MLLSKYPWELSNVYCGGTRRLRWLTAARAVAPPIGMLMVCTIPIVPRDSRLCKILLMDTIRRSPVEGKVVEIPLFAAFYTCQVVGLGISEPSTWCVVYVLPRVMTGVEDVLRM